MSLKDMAGERFGRLVVIARAVVEKPTAHWECLCDCGATKAIDGHSLRRGMTTSCGCFFAERAASARSHGHTVKGQSKEYRSYRAMLARCYNPRNKEFNRYGQSGVQVCDEWRGAGGFERFLAEIGAAPSSRHTVDRINGSQGYSARNCRWATPAEQVANRSITKSYRGKPLAEWARELGINYCTLMDRWRAGDRGERLFRPPANQGPRQWHPLTAERRP